MSNVRPLYLPMTYQDAPDHGLLILRDGSTATIRLSRIEDLPAVKEFYARLSPQSRRMRFFSETKPGEQVMLDLCDASNPRRGMTLLVWRFADGAPRVVASGSYFAHTPEAAEFAVAVDDAFHGKGLGGLLLERLSVLAASHGFLHFNAFTHTGNRAMLDVFRNSGFQLKEQFQDGLVEVDLSLAPGPASVTHALQRDRLFTKASLRPFFCPASVAVIGASRDPANLGHRLFMTLLRGQFRGVVYPVNPNASQVSGVKAYPGAEHLPEPVDLAIIAVPCEQVPGVVDHCARRGVRALIVVSAGYAETGAEGRRRQDDLLDQVRGYGMRLLGPNCLGLINTDPEVRLNASMAAAAPARGRIAISSQSGALGMALLELAGKRNLGVSMFASMGNKADVTGNDLLYYWEDDPSCDVILLYLESFGNPRRFGRIAREVSRRKPIICVKPGRHPHSTGDHAVEALFQQTGVIRAASLEEMFDVAALLGAQPLPPGPRVVILTNSHGAGLLCEDACGAENLIAVSLQDLGADARPGDYEQRAAAALKDPACDAVIAIYIPVTPADTEPYLRGMDRALQQSGGDKPALMVMTSGNASSHVWDGGGKRIPCYLFPETAAHALAAARRYRKWRDDPPGVIPDYESIDIPAIRARLAQHTTEEALSREATAAVLTMAGISTSPREEPAVMAIELDVHQDRVFGPVLSFSLAGYHRELLHDIAYRMIPLTDEETRTMIQSIRGFPLLQSCGADLEALQDLILRLSFLAEELPEMDRVRLAPVQIGKTGTGCAVTGAEIGVQRQEQG